MICCWNELRRRRNNLDDVERCGLLNKAISPSFGQRDGNKLDVCVCKIAWNVELDDGLEGVVVHPTSRLQTLQNVVRFEIVVVVVVSGGGRGDGKLRRSDRFWLLDQRFDFGEDLCNRLSLGVEPPVMDAFVVVVCGNMFGDVRLGDGLFTDDARNVGVAILKIWKHMKFKWLK